MAKNEEREAPMKKPIQYNVILMLAFLLLAGTVCLIPLLQTQASDPTQPSTMASTAAPATTQPVTTAPPTTVPPTTVPLPTIRPDVEVPARNAFVYNCTRDHLAYIKDAGDEVMYPASITKLFSAYVALQYVAPDRMVTVGEIIDTVPEDSSFAWLTKGDRIRVEDLVKAMLLPSGGDAARTLAVEVGRVLAGSNAGTEWSAMERFVEEMNRQAAELGMDGTHFVNPDGYHHEDHYTCLADLLTIGKLSLENDLIRQIAGMTEATATLGNGLTLTWPNTNLLLQKDFAQYYCPEAIGLKTGHTGAAGSCLMAAFEKDGDIILIGIFGSETKLTRFTDALTLFEAYE